MIKFEKISKQQWGLDLVKLLATFLTESYSDIVLPERATRNSSGYDFFAPFSFNLAPGDSITVPTGIRMVTDEEVWLLAIPRSGLGCKFRLQLDNTVGDIDCDYWESDNEGHIFAKLTNDGKEGKRVDVAAGERFMQGILLPYRKVDGDNCQTPRNGGQGSTGK